MLKNIINTIKTFKKILIVFMVVVIIVLPVQGLSDKILDKSVKEEVINQPQQLMKQPPEHSGQQVRQVSKQQTQKSESKSQIVKPLVNTQITSSRANIPASPLHAINGANEANIIDLRIQKHRDMINGLEKIKAACKRDGDRKEAAKKREECNSAFQELRRTYHMHQKKIAEKRKELQKNMQLNK